LPRRLVDLNGDQWRLGRAPASSPSGRAAWADLESVEEWLPAVVPGNVRADLHRAGRLADPLLGTQFEASRWVDEHCWWFLRTWSLDLKPGQRVHLVLRGVDYISEGFLNGHRLGRHEGMFSPQVHDVTGLVQSDNVLAIRILGSAYLPGDRSSLWEKLLNRVEARLGAMPGDFPDRRDTLKCQMSYGWDFAPPLRTMGIWDDVYAVVSDGPWIRDVAASADIQPGSTVLLAEIEIDAASAQPCQLQSILEPETFAGEPQTAQQQIHLQPGVNRASLHWAIEEARLWWPWDQGFPDLYRLTLRLVDGEGQVLDTESQVLGLRSVEIKGWAFRVNGRPLYARGANWVPASILPGLVTTDDYEALLSLAKQANMNFLRIWGGGLREKKAFYELCDRKGILIWQEFPLACAFLARFPRAPDYLALVENEVQAIVRDLRNHPCLAVWCGGNEFSPDRNQPLLGALGRIVNQEDPSRPFLPSSPVGGDSHFWRVWHHFQPPAAYLTDDASFASEFGLQAPPSAQALRCFLPEGEVWPPGPSWAAHGAGLKKLWRYARPFLDPQGSTAEAGSARPGLLPSGRDLPGLEAFVEASQRAQAQGLQIAVEHYRRQKSRGCGGALVWQLNEPWPAISWALVDFYRQPKDGYYAVQRAFQPLLVSLEYPLRHYQEGDALPVRIWLIQDGHESLPGCELQVTLWDESGRVAENLLREVDVSPAAAAPIGEFSWTLPAGDTWCLTCQLGRDGEVLTSNEYLLDIHDGIQPTLRQRLWAWLTSLVIPN
jgi:beta-mannosidase